MFGEDYSRLLEIGEDDILLDEESDLEETFDLTHIEQVESKFLKPDQTAFHVSNGGKVLTPFHSSITRIMKIFDFGLTGIKRSTNKVSESYEHLPRTDTYTAFVTYEIRRLRIELKEITSGDMIGVERDFLVIDPFIKLTADGVRYESVDMRHMIKYYPHNSFQDVALSLAKTLITDGLKTSKYLV